VSSIERAVERLNWPTDKAPRQAVVEPLPLAGGKTGGDQPTIAAAKPEFRLNFNALTKAGYLTPDAMQSRLAEECRRLKRPLLVTASDRNAPVQNRNLIAITSALPGEGKTFTTFNLAMSIAIERDVTVLLVDGDLAGRSLSRLVGLQRAPGLTDVLLDARISLRDVIVNTNVPKLRIIPAGRVYRDVTELMASEQMRDIAGELSARYSDRVVLFDAPPLLATSQAIVLTAFAGQILVVVDEGKTPQQAIQQAVSPLDKNKLIGMVLNNCRRSSSHKYYESYYGAS